MNQVIDIQPGTIIHGKWNRNVYKVIRKLGSGAIGDVYLVSTAKGLFALKISEDSMSITSEVTVLKQFSKVQGSFLGPFLFDVDDLMYNNRKFYFYIMEYIVGESLLTYMKGKKLEWGIFFLTQLLKDLDALHQKGWVFGDLKPDNLIVSRENRIRLLDVGGATVQGRAIKEYTEFFDRGYWQLGTRKAEPTYDLFAVGMILLNMVYPMKFIKGQDAKEELKKKIQGHPELADYQGVLTKALFGGYTNALEMRNELLQLLMNPSKKSSKNKTTTPLPTQSPRKTKKKRKKWVDILEVIVLLIAVISGYTWYIYFYL